MALTLVGLLLAACGTATPAPGPTSLPAQPTAAPATDAPPAATEEQMAEPLVLIDGFGREVSLPAPAQRILSMAPSNTEILFAIGAGAQVVAREDTADYPPEALDLTSIGSTFGELNTEAIVSLDPDLVLAADITSPEQIAALEDLGFTVFVLGNPLDFDGLYANLELAGQLTGRVAEAAALIEQLQARVSAVLELTAQAQPRTVFYEVDGTDPTAPWTTGRDTFQDLLIQMAGGSNVAAGISGWGQLNLEELVAQDPQVMIFAASPWIPTTVDSVAERPGWGAISAVANGEVYAVDTNWIDRPGPRLVDALEALARAIHPELFEG